MLATCKQCYNLFPLSFNYVGVGLVHFEMWYTETEFQGGYVPSTK